MTFWKMVGAYLTGWVIAQAVFLRVVKYVRQNETEEFKDEVASYVARRLADELESRGKGGTIASSPLIFQQAYVISKLHEAVAFLRSCEASGERGADHEVVMTALEAAHQLQ